MMMLNFFNNTIYSKETQKLYELEYINYGSKNCVLAEKGKNISKTRNSNFQKRLKLEKSNFNKRIDILLRKYNGRLFKFILRFLDVQKTKQITKDVVVEFIKNDIRFKNIDIELIDLLKRKRLTRKKVILDFKLTKKYGKLKKIINYSFSAKEKSKHINNFKKFEKRVTTIHNKIKRRTKSTPLHTAKHKYRTDVARYTKKSIKEHGLKNFDLVDKYTYNVDHIVPIMYGFKNNIPPEAIGDIRNLQVIEKIENIKKRCNIDFQNVNMELFATYLGE